MKSTSIVLAAVVASIAALPLACSSDPAASAGGGDASISLGDGGFVDAPEPDGSKIVVDGGFQGPDGSVIRADRFVSKVVSFTPGDCAGFGLTSMPGVVYGPPVGAGTTAGGLDVVSLGHNGEIVLGFAPNGIVDGTGADFIVFENAFWAGGDSSKPTAELAEVSVSDDGVTWKPFPCVVASGPPEFGTCAGWRPVYSAPGNGISPIDPKTAGGDPYDLATIGVTSASFVRIRDLGTVDCPANPASKPTTNGFDLDAIAIVNAKTP